MFVEQLTTFFAWNSAINIAFLLIATLALAVFRGWAMGIHSAMTGVAQEALPRLYFQYLSAYKVLTLVLCVVPYLVLRFVM